MIKYKQFTEGQQVKNVYGEILTVAFQRDCQVWVVGEHAHYHPSKLFAIAQVKAVAK